MWEPLPLIAYGYAVHPLIPSARRDTRYSSRTHHTSGFTDTSGDDQIHRDVVSLEVGDEIYAFEKYTPKGKETEGIWYRGYVVCTARRPPVTWSLSGDPSSSKSTPKIEEPQQVFIGIFPASHVYVRDELHDAEGTLQNLAHSMDNGVQTGENAGPSSSDMYSQWSRSNFTGAMMSTLPEESEDFDTASSLTGVRLPRLDQVSLSHAGAPVYSSSRSARSLRSSSPSESQVMKPLPPRPSLKSGDDTASGATQPIIDEIASALREWHIFLYQYLAKRDYRLFQIVREHIESLHLGRRQLLAQTLSTEETINLRRECVIRLVKGNIVQGLDVIVRHPSWGGLVTVDIQDEVDTRTWVSAIRMYSMQVALAYLDFDESAPVLHPPGPLPTPAHSAFPELTHKTRMKSLSRVGPSPSSNPPTAKFYHVFLDMRAFVASFCSPGETAELLFSLYRLGPQAQFITEDFCTVLNHNGVLARNPSARIRTLFTDLSLSDLQEPIYLVCRVIRNGSLKIGTSFSSGVPLEIGRKGSESRSEPSAATPWADPYGPVSPGNTRVYPSADGQFRRPFGCAVLELNQLAQMAADNSDVHGPKEYLMPIYVPTNEFSFSMLHQNIIENNTKEFEKSVRAETLAVSIKVYHGDAPTIIKENTSVLQDTPHTLRLGFPDVVFPGDVRNELYIKLWSGNFQVVPNNSSRRSVGNFARGPIGSSAMNMQVTVEVRDEEGRTIEGAISKGSGEPFLTYFHSLVFQRCHEPTFGELIKIQLPLDEIPSWHLFFTFRIRSHRERGGQKLDPPYAFAFLPLYPQRPGFIEDGAHSLVMYRADKLAQITPEQYLSSPPLLLPTQTPETLALAADMQRNAPPTRDTLVIRSSLCSTKYSQNSVLLSLLNWEKLPDGDKILSQVLTAFAFVGEVEIVKFLRDIFDALFGILVSQDNQSREMDHLVFNAIVVVLGIVQDRRFSNFRPVVDLYIQQHFSWAAASSHIIHSMNRLLANPTTPENATHLRNALKVWHYIIKFIARSRELQKAKELGMGSGATAEHLELTFKRELRAHLVEVTRMMSTTTPPSIIGTQTIALQNFTSILPELAKIFSTVDLVSIVTSFATNAVAASKGKIVIWKLIMYLQIVKGFLFDNPESRPLLVEAVVLWIKPHFGRYDEYVHTQPTDSESTKDSARVGWLESIRLCVTIIAVMLDKLQASLVSTEVLRDRRRLTVEKDNVECLLPLLPRLLDSYRELMSLESVQALESTPTSKTNFPVVFPESYPFSLLVYFPSPSSSKRSTGGVQTFNSGLAETAVVLLVLILSSPAKAISVFLESSLDIEGRDRFVTLLSLFFKVSTSILDNECFPKTWLNINILAHQVLVKMMAPVSTLLVQEFVPPPKSEATFDPSLWKEAFMMLLKLLSSEQLCIEEFSPQKRRAVWRLAGDIRGEGSSIMLTLWQALGWGEHSSTTGEPTMRFGGYQVYLNALVGSVVSLCLSHHEQLRNNAVQMLYSMIVSEYHTSGNLEEIENELVTRLDFLFMSESSKDDISGAFFVGQLRHLFDSTEVDENLRERVSNFLDSVDLFLELLLSVRALPEGEEFADERVIATLRLMNFIRRIGRDEIYIKYVHQLVNMHLQSQNYVEAALTLKLHSDLYPWDLNSFVPPMEELGLPQQSKFHRKETLCLLILDYLGKGKAWERAMDICKELSTQHSDVTFNYARLSEILRHQASLLEHIVTKPRYYPDYYLVTFYGNFPAAIRDKRFIYRGYEWEKYGPFCERMLNKHPGSQLLKIAGDPPVDIRFGNGQYIQCTAVTPEPNRESPVFTNPDVPFAVRAYYEHSAINLFSTSRPVKRVTRDGAEEVWIEKVYFTTEETFPTVLRRSQVVDLVVVDISPIENALSEVEDKTKELSILNLRYQNLAKTAQDVSTNALSMALNAAVDPPMNTGISAYRQMFFSPQFLVGNPEQAEIVEKLRAAIDEQVRTLDSCLKLHGTLCSPEFVPFHETLERFFRKSFRDEIHRLGIDDVTEIRTKSPSLKSHATITRYPPSVSNISISRSVSLSSGRRLALPPLQLGRTLSPPPLSPHSPVQSEAPAGPVNQTPLQRHLAHLTRHGINGVSSAPGPIDMHNGNDSFSVESPHDSFVNVGNGIHALQAAQTSGASVTTSNFGGSLGSLSSSLRGRFSRFGSLNFGRRNHT